MYNVNYRFSVLATYMNYEKELHGHYSDVWCCYEKSQNIHSPVFLRYWHMTFMYILINV